MTLASEKKISTNTFSLKKLSKAWWSIYLLISIAMFAMFAFFLFHVFSSDFWIPAFFILPLMISAVVLGYSSIASLTLNVLITSTSIIASHIFSKEEIAFQEVKGYRMVSTAFRDLGLPGYEIQIESKNGLIITIPKSIENQDFLIQWLKDKSFVDLS